MRVVVIMAAGEHFCAGISFAEFKNKSNKE
jgi:hypothetical protein